jgi:hypothetical protein
MRFIVEFLILSAAQLIEQAVAPDADQHGFAPVGIRLNNDLWCQRRLQRTSLDVRMIPDIQIRICLSSFLIGKIVRERDAAAGSTSFSTNLESEHQLHHRSLIG